MKITLAYGRTGLEIEAPEGRADVVEPVEAPGLVDEQAAILAALRAPLGTAPLRDLAAECADGLPAHSVYADLLAATASPAEVLACVEAATTPISDGWQSQIQVGIQRRAAGVYLYSSLPDEVARRALLIPCHDVAAQVRTSLTARGPDARVLILPQGPQTVVYRDDV